MANNDLLVLNELTESGGSLRPSIQVERALAEIKDTFQTSPPVSYTHLTLPTM